MRVPGRAQRTHKVTEILQRTEGRIANVTGPMYLFVFPVPVVCFIAALVTDVAYVRSESLMWLHFSEWLIAAGLAFGALAALVLGIEFLASAVIRSGMSGWTHLALFFGSLVVELFNAFVHTIDGWTAVVPTGLMLSIIGAILAYAAAGVLVFVPVTWVEHRTVRS